MANVYHNRPFVQITAYILAAAVSLSGFTGRNHFLSDVLASSAMGYGIARYVYHKHHPDSSILGRKDEEESRGGLHYWPFVVPHYDRDARDVGLAWTF